MFLPVAVMVAVFPMAKPEYIEDYKEISEELGTNWVDVLIIDTVTRKNDFENISYSDILKSNLNSMKLRVKVYKKKKTKQADGSYDYDWVYTSTKVYSDANSIISFISSNGYSYGNAKDVTQAIEKIDSTEKYDVLIEIKDFEEMLTKFTKEEREWAFGLLQSNGVQQMYGEYIELPENIAVATNGFFAFPTPTLHTITSPFGNRSDPISGEQAFHRGIDIAGRNAKGQPVIACADGIVVSASFGNSYGNNVKVKHVDTDGNTWYTRYAHLTHYTVSKGQTLKRGDVLGAVGSTGYSTGAHLHFELLFGTQLVNPLQYIK